MVYVANVPVSGQSLGDSRPIINSNFTIIQSVFDKNHVDFNSANAGTHTHVDLLTQGSDPNPPATIVSHYSKAVAGVTEWFFQRESTPGPVPGAIIQMSRLTPVAASKGFTFLPGGILLQWGSIAVPFVNPVTFQVPFTNPPFAVVMTGNSANFSVGAITNTGFTASILIAPLSAATWMAVGV